MREYSKRCREAHLDCIKERQRCYREANRERINESRKRWRKLHSEQYNKKHCEESKCYRKAHPEQNKLWRKAHPERIKEYTRRYHESHPNNYRNWQKANADICRANNHRRRARFTEVENTLTVKEWQIIKDTYKHKCVYCGKKLKNLTMDHVIPISKGGGHTKENVVPACKSCNSRKRDREAPAFQRALLYAE
ncbi:MAG: HNH endonuclease [Dehalococcoidia bacterium]